MPPLPQPVVLDLLALAVGKTALKEQMSPEEFRGQISGKYGDLVDGERLKLQVVWNLFAPRTGFDPKVAACPMCWLKTLEGRLGVPVDLPGELSTLKSSDVATNAAKVFVRKEDVDRLLGPDNGVRARATTPLPASYVRAAVAAPPPSAVFDTVMEPVEPGAPPSEPGAPPAEPGAPPLSMTNQMAAVRLPPPAPVSAHQKTFALIAAGALLVSAAVIGITLKGSCAKAPTPVTLRVANLPVKVGEQLGKDANFVLTDPAWLSSPESDRTAQLRSALDGLRPSGVENLAVFDSEGKLRASAQWTGTEARVKFY